MLVHTSLKITLQDLAPCITMLVAGLHRASPSTSLDVLLTCL